MFETICTAVQNNGGGHWNHTFFWDRMTKPGTARNPQDLLKAIDASFGTPDGLMKAARRRDQAVRQRLGGSSPETVSPSPTANQDTPVMTGVMPILGIDVWEHAYYLKYRNLRAKYVGEWFKVVNWDQVAANLNGAKK
ncbi:MAG: superoxide dismutase [Gemmataceae bacterium]